MSIATRIYVEDHPDGQWVVTYRNNCRLVDPVPLAQNELDLGMEDAVNPIRLGPAWTPQWTGAADAQGQPRIYTKYKDGSFQEFSQSEKDELDAEIAAEKAQKEQAKQTAKDQLVKNREKKFKDLGAELGMTFPVTKGDLDNVVAGLMAQIQALLDQNKEKDAAVLQYKATALLAYRFELGDNVYSPLLGDGGV